MNLRAMDIAATVAASVLALSACGGESGAPDMTTSEAASEAAPSAVDGAGARPSSEGPTETRGAVPAVDLGALGGRLKGWEGCTDKPEVDMAGYPVLVCIFPDEYAVPGQDGNAVRVMTFTEWDQADTYVAEYGDPEVTVVEGGYIVDGPHAKAVNAAVSLLKK